MDFTSIDIESEMQRERDRPYTGNSIDEIKSLSRKFLFLAPLYMSCFTWFAGVDTDMRVENYLEIAYSVALLMLFDKLCKHVWVTFLILSILIFTTDVSLEYTGFKYAMYGVAWVIALKMCDHEDSRMLFPVFVLLQRPSEFLDSITDINSQKYVHAVCASIAVMYSIAFHRKWTLIESGDCVNVCPPAGNLRNFLRWTMVFYTSHSVIHHSSLQMVPNDIEHQFDIYKFLEINNVVFQFKDTISFVILVITSCQMIRSFTWRTTAIVNMVVVLCLSIGIHVVKSRYALSVMTQCLRTMDRYIFEPNYIVAFSMKDPMAWRYLMYKYYE